jgi:hypothetical protein
MLRKKKIQNDLKIIKDVKELGSNVFKVINNYLPGLKKSLHKCCDWRNKSYTTYENEYFYFMIILLFLFRLDSLRTIKAELLSEEFIENINVFFGFDLLTVSHENTIKFFFNNEDFETTKLSDINSKIFKTLVRKKVFEDVKLNNKYYLIVLDGTGTMSFKERHCDYCLTKTLKNKDGKFLGFSYSHYLLEAKIISKYGNAISLDTEFIDNLNYNSITNKQDCEHNGGIRLLSRIKKKFPKMDFCVLLDGLYADSTFISKIEEFGWKYFITLKDGDLKSVNEEFQGLLKLDENKDNIKKYGDQTITFVNNIDFKTHDLSVIKSIEPHTSPNRKTDIFKMKFITNFFINKDNCIELLNEGGRCRQIIENQGFNEQKNHYNFEHLYVKNYEAHKAFYFLLQISHLIFQLLIAYMYKSKDVVLELYKAIKVFARKIKQSFLNHIISNIHQKIRIVLNNTS